MSKVGDTDLKEPSHASAVGPQGSHATTGKSPPKPETRAGIGGTYRLHPEEPKLQEGLIPTYTAEESPDLSVGNHNYTVELKEEGNLGVFLDITQTHSKPTLVTIDPVKYFEGIKRTLTAVMFRLIRAKTQLTDVEANNRSESIADDLATGCCVITYLKLRSVHLIDLPLYADSLRKPKVAADLPIPSPFAFAIQQLGAVTVTDLIAEARCVPILQSGEHSFGVPKDKSWNSNAYSQSMEYARNLGMQFATVDLSVKNGTAWWLLKHSYEDSIFELQCPLPEVNYTDSMAVTNTLWMKDTEDDPSNDFVDFSATTDIYAVILRNPHAGINVSSYFALDKGADEIWKNA